MIYKTITGLCTFANAEKSIDVKYINASTFDGQFYSKGKFKRCLECTAEKCPLFEEAPNSI